MFRSRSVCLAVPLTPRRLRLLRKSPPKAFHNIRHDSRLARFPCQLAPLSITTSVSSVPAPTLLAVPNLGYCNPSGTMRYQRPAITSLHDVFLHANFELRPAIAT